MVIGNVQVGANDGEYVPIKFNTPVNTSSLEFDFTGSGPGLREVIAFTTVPEPSSLFLLGLGGLFLWRRVRKGLVGSNQ